MQQHQGNVQIYTHNQEGRSGRGAMYSRGGLSQIMTETGEEGTAININRGPSVAVALIANKRGVLLRSKRLETLK